MLEGNRMSREGTCKVVYIALLTELSKCKPLTTCCFNFYFIHRACTAKQSSDVNFMPNFTQCIGEQSMRTLSGSKLVADPIPQQLMVASAAQRHRRATTFERSQIKILQCYGGTSRSIKTGNKPVEKTREIHKSSNRI